MTQQFSMPDNWDRPTGGSSYGQPPKKKRKWPWIVAAVFAFFVIVGLVVPSEEKADEKPKTVAEASTPAMTSPPKTTSTTTTATTTTTTAAPPTRIVTSVVTSIVEVPATRDIPPTNTVVQAPLPVMPRTSTPVYVPVAPDSDAGAVYYENCTAVKAAGAAPIMQGEAGYRSALDRDGDGVACDK